MIPSIKTCYRTMDRYGMLDNIKEHSIMVARIARLIASGLEKAGIDISVQKATAAALMHDIGKTACLKYGGNHAEIGSLICYHNYFNEIADIVAEHVVLKGYDLNGCYSEKEVVYYADKRVKHAGIVSLDERLDYIIERYGRNQKGLERRIRANFSLCIEVEKKLFNKLDFGPGSLSSRVARDKNALDAR